MNSTTRRQAWKDWQEGKPAVTWAELVELEPRLIELLQRANRHRPTLDPKTCPVFAFYGFDDVDKGLKRQVCQLVGWDSEHRRHPILGSQTAYDLVYKTIWDALGSCKAVCCNGG